MFIVLAIGFFDAVLAVFIAILVSFTKEWYDEYNSSKFDWLDIVADIIGIILGILIVNLCL